VPIPLQRLLERIPGDATRRVEQVKTRFNTTIRRVLREETGLRLGSDDDRMSVPVRLAPGLPMRLRGRALDDDMWLAVTLAPHQDALRRLLSGLAELAPAIAALREHPGGRALIGDRGEHLGPVRELAEALLCEAEKVDLVQWILGVDEDVLGVYEYGAFDFGPDACIGLHWGVIGVCAGGLGVPVEDLALVVLAHELAHAYTHLGRDIDGRRWELQAFRDSEHALEESRSPEQRGLTRGAQKTTRRSRTGDLLITKGRRRLPGGSGGWRCLGRFESYAFRSPIGRHRQAWAW